MFETVGIYLPLTCVSLIRLPSIRGGQWKEVKLRWCEGALPAHRLAMNVQSSTAVASNPTHTLEGVKHNRQTTKSVGTNILGFGSGRRQKRWKRRRQQRHT